MDFIDFVGTMLVGLGIWNLVLVAILSAMGTKCTGNEPKRNI
jgi:uncharacterized membrane protein